MDGKIITRREAAAVAGMGLVGARGMRAEAEGTLTAAQVVERIQAKVGVEWRKETVDHIVLGEGSSKVRGIATTMMATLDVLQRAAAQGRNMVVTHETPVYLHQDHVEDLAGDKTLEYKQRFVKERDMAVFHFHDHWHARRPDGIATGMAREIGWESYMAEGNPRRFTLPSAMTLDSVAHHLQKKLGARTMRVLGDAKLPVRNVSASWGFVSRMPGIPMFREPSVDLFIAGETREWELVEYAQDTIARGERKALIVLGHIASEQAGMKFCAEWLKAIVPEVPVSYVAAAEPFWYPGQKKI